MSQTQELLLGYGHDGGRATVDLGSSGKVLLLGSRSEKVSSAGAHEIGGGETGAKIPRGGDELDSFPLLWEVLDAVGKRTRWPQPDSFSTLLDSLSATRGVPLSERLKTMESSESAVTIQALSGGEVTVTRQQLRAIVSIYS